MCTSHFSHVCARIHCHRHPRLPGERQSLLCSQQGWRCWVSRKQQKKLWEEANIVRWCNSLLFFLLNLLQCFKCLIFPTFLYISTHSEVTDALTPFPVRKTCCQQLLFLDRDLRPLRTNKTVKRVPCNWPRHSNFPFLLCFDCLSDHFIST